MIEKLIQFGHIKDKIIIDTTDVALSTTSSITTLLKANGATYVAASCSGLPATARAAQLLIMVGGPAPAIKSISPYLEGVLAKAVIHAGDEPSNAILLKITTQYLHGGIIYLTCETHTLAEKVGVPASAGNEILGKNFEPYVQAVCQQLTSGAYIPAVGETPTIPLELGYKNLVNCTNVAKDAGMELKSTKLLSKALMDAKTYGEEKGRLMDGSSMYGSVRREAGLCVETGVVKERDARNLYH